MHLVWDFMISKSYKGKLLYYDSWRGFKALTEARPQERVAQCLWAWGLACSLLTVQCYCPPAHTGQSMSLPVHGNLGTAGRFCLAPHQPSALHPGHHVHRAAQTAPRQAAQLLLRAWHHENTIWTLAGKLWQLLCFSRLVLLPKMPLYVPWESLLLFVSWSNRKGKRKSSFFSTTMSSLASKLPSSTVRALRQLCLSSTEIFFSKKQI